MKTTIIQKNVFLILSIFFFTHVFGGNENKNDWFLAKQKNNISIYYRWIESAEGNKTREMKAEFTINSEINEILNQFKSNENYMNWAAGIQLCEITKIHDSLWYTYTVMNYPWPFQQKDLVTKHMLKRDNSSAQITIVSAPQFIITNANYERIKNFKGSWYFFEKGDYTEVRYNVVSFEEPIFPRFMQDPVIQNISINSFLSLIQLSENKSHENQKN